MRRGEGVLAAVIVVALAGLQEEFDVEVMSRREWLWVSVLTLLLVLFINYFSICKKGCIALICVTPSLSPSRGEAEA